MGIKLSFKAVGTIRVYAALKIVLKLVFIEMTKIKAQASKIFQTNWIKYIIHGIEKRTAIIKIKDKFPKL